MNKLNKTALILIDIQQGFDDVDYWGGERNNPLAEENSRKLLDFWRDNKMVLFHIQHCSSDPQSRPMDGETVIKKSVNSAFIGTDLQRRLDDAAIKTVVIAGLTTDHCVSTTTRMAANYGYETYLIADATATFAKKGIYGEEYDAETMHLTALAQLNNEFATIITTEALLKDMHTDRR